MCSAVPQQARPARYLNYDVELQDKARRASPRALEKQVREMEALENQVFL